MKRTQKIIVTGILLVLLALLATGCGGGKQEDSAPVRSGEVTVEMRGMKYLPAKLTVKKGARITFVNRDTMEHDVIQAAVKELGKADPGFNSGVIDPGQSWSVEMDEPGTYPILCSQMGHYTAGMVGTITVVE